MVVAAFRHAWVQFSRPARLLVVLMVVASGPGNAVPAAAQGDAYELGSGDELRIIVYDEEDLSGEFKVDDSGSLSLPLIGAVKAGGKTLRQLEALIATKLLDGYLKSPRVNAEVLNYRPFFVDGEVEEPGEYPFRSGLTIREAVAIAGGYKYWANKKSAEISRRSDPERAKIKVPVNTIVQPGDHIWIDD